LDPFFQLRHGDGLVGWQAWPVAMRQHKEITWETNGWGDVTMIPGHDRSFYIWPFCMIQSNNIGSDNPEKFRASLPFWAYTRSPKRDTTEALWPFFEWVNDRDKKYKEWEGPWPFVIFTRGEGKHTDRVWPIFSQSRNATQEVDSYLWPIYKTIWYHNAAMDDRRTRSCIYLYINTTITNKETGLAQKRLDMWPFFIWRQAFDGSTRLQIIAPIEPILLNKRGIERNWSPLWSIWRQQHNTKTGESSESFLWNLYRHEAGPDHKKISLLFGLFRYQREGGNSETRVFYIPFSHTKKVTHPDGPGGESETALNREN
jgi:hypothetical protein